MYRALFAEGSPTAVLEGFGSLGGWTTRNASAFTALLCGLEDARAAGVKRLEVFTPTALCIKHMPLQYRDASFGRASADTSIKWLRGLKAAVIDELRAFVSVTVKKSPNDDGARTAARMATFGLDDDPPDGETPNASNQLDRVFLTYLRHVHAAATHGALQDSYRAFAVADLQYALASLAGAGPADADGGSGGSEDDEDGDGGGGNEAAA